MSKTLSDAEYKRYRELLEEKYRDEWGSDDDPYKDKNRFTTGSVHSVVNPYSESEVIEKENSTIVRPAGSTYEVEIGKPSLGQIEIKSPDTAAADPKWKYCEDKIVADFRDYLAKTYSEHYKTEDENIECFDAWIALGDSGPTFRNTALKYLWRFGQKDGKNKKDVMKAMHYVLMLMYVEHYRNKS